LGTDDFMLSVNIIVHTLEETEAHLLDSSKDRVNSPSAEFSLVIGDFTGEARDALVIKFFRPLLSLLIPFMESVQVHLFVSCGVPAVNCTSNKNSFGVSSYSLPKAVNVTNSGNNLVFMFNVRVFFFQLNGSLILHLRGGDPGFVDASGLIHKLSSTTDCFVIGRLVISLSSLSNSKPVENVLLLTLVYKEPVINLFNLQIPSKLSFRSAHESRESDISTEDISYIFLSKSLDDGIFRSYERSRGYFTLEDRKFLGSGSAGFFESIVVSV
jgi:hypothetical protein